MSLRPEQLELLELLPDGVVDLVLDEWHRAGPGGELTIVLAKGADDRVDERRTRVLPAWRRPRELTRRRAGG